MPAHPAINSVSPAATMPNATRVKRARALVFTGQLRDTGEPPRTPCGATPPPLHAILWVKVN
jgi:hypothetical protein